MYFNFQKQKRKSRRSPLERVLLSHNEFMTVVEVAWFLRVSHTSVYTWMKEQREAGFPEALIRKERIVFRISDLERYFDLEIGSPFVQPLLSVRDLMELTGYSESWIRQEWMKEVPVIEISCRLKRIRKRDLEEFLHRRYNYPRGGETWEQYRENTRISVIERLRIAREKEKRVVIS